MAAVTRQSYFFLGLIKIVWILSAKHGDQSVGGVGSKCTRSLRFLCFLFLLSNPFIDMEPAQIYYNHAEWSGETVDEAP